MAFAYSYPKQGLQPFTKVYGEPLHEEKDEEKQDKADKLKDTSVHSKHSNSQDDQSDDDPDPATLDVGFNYSSDDDDEEEEEDFADIVPDDAPPETITTLKTLCAHVRSNEKRQFTKLERQLLGTVVKHGIMNGTPATKPTSPAPKPTSPAPKPTSPAPKPSSLAPAEPISEVHCPVESFEDLPLPPSRPPLRSWSAPKRPALLDVPILPKRTQQVMKCLQQKASFYHPDDEPAVQLLEGMTRFERANESVFDDAISSFYSHKRRRSPEPRKKSRQSKKRDSHGSRTVVISDPLHRSRVARRVTRILREEVAEFEDGEI